MRNRHLLHHTKVNDFLEFVKSRGYKVHETKGSYEAFRIKKNGKFVIGHKRDRSDHITIHGEGLFLISEFLKDNNV